jgi:probable HAF family extracellular repeat protein
MEERMKLHPSPAGFARLPARRLITVGAIAGTIVGASAIAALADSHGSGSQPGQVMVTSASGMEGSFAFRTIDNQADPTFNQLLGINNHGRIAGYFGSGADAAHPNKGYTVSRPYAQANFKNENFPGSVQTQVVGINNRGTTVGFYVDAAGANIGFVRRFGMFTSVINPATPAQGGVNQLLGLNNEGMAAGFYNDAGGAAHGYIYNFTAMAFSPVTLPVAADSVTATGINDAGDISGFYTVGHTTNGFVLDEDHGFRKIRLGAGTNTQALGINQDGQVVGSFVDGAGTMHGFVWSHGRTRQIDDPNHGAGGTLVNGLNDRGQLVGFYVDNAGNTHGFLASSHR